VKEESIRRTEEIFVLLIVIDHGGILLGYGLAGPARSFSE
jgi:hypothetical protein